MNDVMNASFCLGKKVIIFFLHFVWLRKCSYWRKCLAQYSDNGLMPKKLQLKNANPLFLMISLMALSSEEEL